MKQKLMGIALILIFALSVMAKSGANELQTRTKESIAGVWKGRFAEAPAIDIELKVNSDNLSGKATFYVVQNTDAGPVIKSKVELPLLEPSFDGKDLLVNVKRNNGSYFKARMRFIADNEAILKPVDDHSATDEMAITMFRQK